ncbi:UDP-glucose 4-epimerase GalE [Corynebacterium nasicanis]|uniref:UDP-glucose 4-epimerase n=1 Tax=Corynebacterium nasicanis TaxID=1448267 RepID=A0ABW1QHF3_9CORY
MDRLDQPVLVTGGTGFIGSHIVVELLRDGRQVVIIDDLSNSHPAVLHAVAELGGAEPVLEVGDIRDRAFLADVLARHRPGAAIHFAAKKAVGESVEIPATYLDVNIGGTATLVAALHDAGVRTLVFSSSCSVHGETDPTPLNEDSPVAPANPYAYTKLTGEQMLARLVGADPSWATVALRYFNPIGAHPSGLLGEAGKGRPLNIMPWLVDVASGRQPELAVFGDDWPTPDGTCVRDYLHVVDVARVHVLALRHLEAGAARVFNIGSGVGTSVLELIDAMEEACGREIPYRIAPRRDGDVSSLVADARLVQEEWGWRPEFTVADMCADTWRYEQQGARLSRGD